MRRVRAASTSSGDLRRPSESAGKRKRNAGSQDNRGWAILTLDSLPVAKNIYGKLGLAVYRR